MRITDLLDKRSICLDGAPGTKSEALDQMVALMVKSGKINDEEGYRKQVYAREEESTTGIGEGIAIPHGKCDAVSKPGLAAMVVKNGVDFDALDGEPVNLIFLIAAPNTEDNIHLNVLSKLSVLLMDEEFTESLKQAASVDEFLAIIDKADAEKNGIDERLADTGSAEKAQHKLLAVTSCPTGIAHTYMAAEGIEKAAKAHDCFVKVVTRGSGGAKNVLTDKEIAEADCIIITADAQVPMSRFEGKKVIIRQVSDGISKANELVELAISGNVPVYHDASAPAQQQTQKSGGAGHKIYTYLMNGVSHMLPFVVGGGILIALAFLIDGLCVDLNSLSEDLRGNFGTITPVAALLKGIGGTAFGFMLPVLAAVMVGGMTPPCAIALATLLFKNKFTKEELEAGPTNFIMGLAFITEGAIPYAASDPLHVLPACIAGSAVAGAISMAFQCTLMAPHGGIFVFMVVGNAWMYLVALLAGTAVSTALLGILKKNVI